MTTFKRSRGRPAGSCKHDDSKPLAEMADLMLANPQMKIKAAASRIAPRFLDNNEAESVARRFIRAWNKHSETLMKQAAKRLSDREPVRYVGGGGGGYMTATEHLAGYGRGHSAALAASGFGYGLGAADTLTAMMRENERRYLCAPPVSEVQRASDMIREYATRHLPPRSLQDEVMDIMRKEEERRRLYERAAPGYPNRGY